MQNTTHLSESFTDDVGISGVTRLLMLVGSEIKNLKCTPLSRQKNRELKVEALPTKKCLLPAFVTQRIPVEVFGNSMPDDAFECYRT
jgi:hypothetical protein